MLLSSCGRCIENDFLAIMESFNEAHKREKREKQFHKDLENAFHMGARPSGGKV